MKGTVGFLAGIYNEGHRVVECLDWHMPYMDEAVIVIQQSEDGTEEIVDKYVKEHPEYKIKVLHFPKMGCSEKTLQFGANEITSEWIIYIDMDEKFPLNFLKNMKSIVGSEEFYNGFRFKRHNWFDVQVFNDAVPIEPKVIRVRHPARDDQVRLTRRSMTIFPPQIHVRARVRDAEGDEKIKTLDYAMYHLKTLDEQWIDNKSYVEPTEQVKRFEEAKKEARAKGLPVENVKLEDC